MCSIIHGFNDNKKKFSFSSFSSSFATDKVIKPMSNSRKIASNQFWYMFVSMCVCVWSESSKKRTNMEFYEMLLFIIHMSAHTWKRNKYYFWFLYFYFCSNNYRKKTLKQSSDWQQSNHGERANEKKATEQWQ